MIIRLSRRVVATALIAIVSATGAFAQSSRPPITDHKTPGGISFRHTQIADPARHAIMFGWRDGYDASGPGKEALAILGARLTVEGSPGLSRNEYSERLKDINAATNFSGSRVVTSGSLSAPPDKIAEAAAMFAAVITKPALAPDRLTYLQKVMATGARQNADSPESMARQVFTRATIGAGPLMDALLVQPEAYARVTLADIEAWRAAVLVRDKVVVASAGPMTADAAGLVIDTLLGGLPATSPPRAEAAPPKMQAPGKTIVIERAVVQTVILAGGPTGWHVDQDALRASFALQSMFGFEGPLWRAVREKLGAAYGVSGSLADYHPKARGFAISTNVDNARAVAALAAIREEYGRFVANGLSEDTVAAIKTKVLSGESEAYRQAGLAAMRMLSAGLGTYPADHLETLSSRVNALTAASINEGIKAKFPKEPLTVVIVAPSAAGFKTDCVIRSLAEISKCE